MHGAGSPVRFIPWSSLVLSLLLLLGWHATEGAAPPGQDDDPDAPASGLLARFGRRVGPRAEAEPEVTRVVADVAARWAVGSPDPRVPADGFHARYRGMLLIQAPGIYRFFGRTDGAVTLRLAGKGALEGAGEGLRSSPLELAAGFAPLELDYQHDRGVAHLAIDWEGPGFAREPLPARLLFHEPEKTVAADRFEEGRRHADRLGCANCHRLLDLPRHPNLGPPLDDAARSIAPPWLAAWLADPTKLRRRSRMPAFGSGLKPREVADLTAFLANLAPRPKERQKEPTAEVKMALNVADPDQGRLLFRSAGCLGCHTRGEIPGIPMGPVAPDLADLGRKRTTAWLAEYLHHPKKGGPSPHRADLRLSSDHAAHLAAYLVTDQPPSPALPPGDPPHGEAARGKELASRLRCAACHEIPGLDPPRADLPLTADSRADAGCLADPSRIEDAGAAVPRYALSEDERQALRALVAQLPSDPAPTSPETLAADTLRRLNCLGCHIRDGQGGTMLGPQLAAYLAGDAELGTLKGTLTPPDLSAVGDKLRGEYLTLAVKGMAPTARPWLSVRMPTFRFEPGEAESLVALFQGRDRMERRADPPHAPTRPDAATFERAVALIGQRGFGCVNCHVLAGKIPPGGEPETLGPDLALAHRRMTERYFQRWIANPQRIIPGTPMPQFLQPVASIPGSLEDQLDTLWQLLGSTRVAEAAAQGTREILKRQGDRALIVRDMVLLPGAPDTEYTPRGLAIGLKNDHALLFDTDRLTWLAAWHRGFLSRTKSGRLWEWHPEGDRLWVTARRLPPVAFLDANDKVLLPRQERGRYGRFLELDFRGSDVALSYALNPPEGYGERPIEVAETIRPTADGWERTVRINSTAMPPTPRPVLVVQAAVNGSDDDSELGASRFAWKAGADEVALQVTGARPARVQLPDDRTAHLFVLNPVDFSARIRLMTTVTPR